MSENDNENLNSPNETADEVEDTSDTDNNGQQDDNSSADDGESEVERLKKQNQKLFERAKKAEGYEKQPDGSWVKVVKKPDSKPEAKPAPVAKTEPGGLTALDAIAISKSNVHEDDVEEVVRWAKFNNITVKDALKDKTLKIVLANRSEERATAEATNTGSTRRGSSKPTDDQILDAADKGKDVDPTDLANARWNKKVKK